MTGETAPTFIPIVPDRLEADLEAVNRLGQRDEATGINRLSFSDADMAGRRWLMDRLSDAGLTARMDGVGNVFGRWEPVNPADRVRPVVLAGSHLDTVPRGGPFDGTLGVCAALEAVRALQDAGFAPRRPVEVLATADEEGRFGGMLGSQAICGEVDAAWIATAQDDRGVTLAEAMRGQGLDPETAAAAAVRDMAGVAVFLELHVEQGPVLERAGLQAAVVDGVSGVFNWTVRLLGEANHSGTTPMDGRRDAFRGLADFGAAIPRVLAQGGGPESRLTVGKVTLRPNFPHSIPGVAEFSVIGRDPEAATMRALAAECWAALAEAAEAHGLTLAVEERSWLDPVRLDPAVAGTLLELAADQGLAVRTMASGAGHDAQTFARHCPSGLIFVPSVGGISHAPEEWTDRADIEQGTALLARAMAWYAGRANEKCPERKRIS